VNGKETAYWAIIIALFASAIALLLIETRPIWAREKLIHEGKLNAHYETDNVHFFDFQNETVTISGWLWKKYFPVNATVAVYKKGPAVVVRAVTEPTLT